jgi:hypothetical protein
MTRNSQSLTDGIRSAAYIAPSGAADDERVETGIAQRGIPSVSPRSLRVQPVVTNL